MYFIWYLLVIFVLSLLIYLDDKMSEEKHRKLMFVLGLALIFFQIWLC